MNNIYLIVGESGSGKSTIERKLIEDYRLKKVLSYTTRPVRKDDPKDVYTHTFVSKGEFDKLINKVGYTSYGGYEYCATAEQIDNADIYIIDPDGIEYFEKNYKGKKGIVKIYIHCPMTERMERLEKRDGFDEALRRIKVDIIAFRGVKDSCDYIITNKNGELDNTIKTIAEFITESERETHIPDVTEYRW